ncbi:MAG: 4-hydroxy-tetrahydrodipicolinate reductase [Planctomycetales bacterium]
MSSKLKVGVNGAAGRMGQRVIALTHQDAELSVAVALENADSPALGKDAGELAGIGKINVPLTSELTGGVDVVIDFSTPEGLMTILKTCEERQIPLVVATTGLTPAQREEVLSAAQTIPLLLAPSMSLAVNMTMKLAREAAKMMRHVTKGVDVEIIEKHHRFKEDAPSGTALHFGKIVSEEMGQTDHKHGRSGRPGARSPLEIGYHAVRIGDNVGEHQILFGMLGEVLELSVKSSTRDSYAYGALTAAKFLVTKKAGLYGMNDVLGL